MEEAYRHRQLLRMTENHFESWGYLPVLTPVFDFFETYRPLLSKPQEERSYRFPDREGELLMLRSDITLFLAKQMGISLKNAALPRRVYYADSIIRHQEDEDISSDEFFQSGAELIGMEGMDGDLEVLLMLHDLLDSMQLPTWRMHIGSRALLDAILAGNVNPVKAENFLEIRDEEGLYKLFAASRLKNAEERAKLLMFMGTPDEFSTFSLEHLNEIEDGRNIRRAVENLISLASSLSELTGKERIRIDLSEHGGQPYYTGFTVKVYVEGANTAIASGGRYDKLLGAFGTPAAAAGFSLMMRKLEPLSKYAEQAALKIPIVVAEGDSFSQRYNNSLQDRKEGKRVTLS